MKRILTLTLSLLMMISMCFTVCADGEEINSDSTLTETDITENVEETKQEDTSVLEEVVEETPVEEETKEEVVVEDETTEEKNEDTADDSLTSEVTPTEDTVIEDSVEETEEVLDLNKLTSDELFEYILGLTNEEFEALYDEYANLDDLMANFSDEQVNQLNIKLYGDVLDDEENIELADETVEEKAVAKIGDKEYSDFVEAFGELQDGDTLTLMDNTTVTLKDTNSNFDGSDKSLWSDTPNVTLDLNNYTLTSISNYGGSYNVLNVLADGWTIKNGSLIVKRTSGSADSYAIAVECEGANIIIDNVSLSGGVATYSTAVVTMKDTSMGTTEVAATNYYCGYVESGAKFIINGGTYTSNGTGPVFYAASNSHIEINDGNFNGPIFVGKDDTATISIYGGTFSNDVSSHIDTENYRCVKDGDLYKVEKIIVATVGDKTYPTLQKAIDATSKGTINLVDNTCEDIVVASDKEIELIINKDVTLTNKSSHTIVNSGKLTITGDGTIDNITDGKGDLVNNYGASATLKGGVKFTRSKEASSSKDSSGGNSWYNISNQGTMTIGDGVSVTSSGAFSSLIKNGEGKKYEYASLTINSGTFSGGINTIKNGDFGKLYINGGSFANTTQATLLNWAYAEIAGGAFSPTSNASDAVLVGVWKESDYQTEGLTIITGGTFNGSFSQYNNEEYKNKTDAGSIIISGGKFSGEFNNDGTTKYSAVISGGTFTSDVSKYLASGYNILKIKDNEYIVSNASKEEKVEVEEVTPAVEEKTIETIKDEGTTITVKDEKGEEKKLELDSSTDVSVVLESKEITKSESTSKEDKVFTESEKKEVVNKVVEEVQKSISDSKSVSASDVGVIPLDITLNIVTKKDGEETKTQQVSTLSKNITVTLYLDNQTMEKVDGKIVKVVRIHDGVTDVLETKLNGNALSFETDKFSTYVITYTQPKEVKPETSDTSTKSYDPKDKNHDGIISCEEEMNSKNWIWSESKKACVYKVTNTGSH